MPRLTVLFPVHNAMPFLPEAIESLLGQDVADALLILALDDGSTDGSRQYLERLGHPRIVVSPSESNLGPGATLNRGLDLIGTEFFARMDADDLCSPSRVRLQLDFLRQHGDVGVVGCQFHYFSSGGQRTLSTRLPLTHEGIVRGLRGGRLSIVHGSLVGRTEILRQSGGYRLRGYGEDWDLFLRLGERTRLANLPDDLYGWRMHGGNAGLSHLMEQQLGIDYAIHVAGERAAGRPEPSPAEFRARLHHKPLLARWGKRLDVLALAHYRLALSDLSIGRRYRGLARLGLSASLSPRRALRRLARELAPQ
jgi:glycosyltransferase involved in cell wall biosynthesis